MPPTIDKQIKTYFTNEKMGGTNNVRTFIGF
jgi:hypothetical protein